MALAEYERRFRVCRSSFIHENDLFEQPPPRVPVGGRVKVCLSHLCRVEVGLNARNRETRRSNRGYRRVSSVRLLDFTYLDCQ